MNGGVRFHWILDKVTDDDTLRRLKESLRQHLDDFVDLMETQPNMVEDWKASPTPDEHLQWRSEEDCAEAERIRVAAYNHFLGRHPAATTMEMSKAYAAYSALVRRWFAEKDPLP